MGYNNVKFSNKYPKIYVIPKVPSLFTNLKFCINLRIVMNLLSRQHKKIRNESKENA